jgi:hypothetical protein
VLSLLSGTGMWMARLDRDGMLVPALFIGIGMTAVLGICIYRLLHSLRWLRVPLEIRFSNGVLSVVGVLSALSHMSIHGEAIASIACRPGGWMPGFQTFLLLEVSMFGNQLTTARIPWPGNEPMIPVENALREAICPAHSSPLGNRVLATARAMARRGEV